MVKVFAIAILALLAPLEGGGVMFAAKQIFLGRSAKAAAPTARSYVQDGLVALFDAKENKDWGVHDPAATTWIDLTGNELALSFWNSSFVTWQDGYMRCRGWAYNQSRSRSYPRGVTVEWVSPSYVLDDMRPKLDFVGYTFPQSYLLRTGVFNAGPGDQTFSGILAAQNGSRSATMSVDASGATVYFNDKGLSYRINGTYSKLSGSAQITIGMIDNSKYAAAHCFRVYNRALIADEIAANYAIDKVRFNLP